MADKLTDLIKFRDELTAFVSQLQLNTLMDQQIARSLSLAELNPVSMSDQLSGVATRYKEYCNQYHGIVDAYKKIIAVTNRAIESAGYELIESTELMDKNALDIMSTLEARNSGIPSEILSQLYQHSNTLYPGLIFTPCTEEYIRYMAASDPLYLLGGNLGYLKTIIKNLPDQYQGRLGLYDNIEKLPMNQFSIIIASDFFHQLPYPHIIEYLQTSFRLLRPGGCIIFTFNNCDIYEVAQSAESKKIVYASQSMLTKDSISIGYEVLDFNNNFINVDSYNFTSWAMLKKPGELTTIKRSQAQGLLGRK